jgi:hypothetical protein
MRAGRSSTYYAGMRGAGFVFLLLPLVLTTTGGPVRGGPRPASADPTSGATGRTIPAAGLALRAARRPGSLRGGAAGDAEWLADLARMNHEIRCMQCSNPQVHAM